MAVPDYQTLMLPVLQLLGDGQVRRVVPDITDPLADQFQLTPDERQQMLPSGLQATLVNRTHWAVTYMNKAGLPGSTGAGPSGDYRPRTAGSGQEASQD